MRFGLARIGSMRDTMAAELIVAEKATTSSVRKAGSNAQNEFRRVTRRAGLGQGVEKAWRKNDYPKGRGARSLGAASVVYSKASRIVNAFSANRIVRPRRQQALLIATAQGEKLGLATEAKRRAPIPQKIFDSETAEANYGPLFVVRGQPGELPMLFGTVDGLKTPLAFIVASVRLQRVYDLDRVANKWNSRLPGYIVSAFNRAERPRVTGPRVFLD